MKKILCTVIALMICFSSASIYAAESDKIYTEYKFYKASVYICDPANKEIVLRNVKPLNPVDGLLGARDIEYRAVKMNTGCLFDKSGKALTPEEVNGAFLDLEAVVLTGKNKNGQRVLYIRF